jgi:hypothetical protein
MKSRNFYILIAAVVVGFNIFWLNVYAFIELEVDYNAYQQRQTSPDLTPIVIEGTGIKGGRVVLTVSLLKSLAFQQVYNKPFQIMNRYYNQYVKIYSGVSLWSVLDRLDILTKPASELTFRFYSHDGYASPRPLSLILAKNFTASVILAYEENGQPIIADGPIRSVMEQPIMPEGEFSSQYCVKMVKSIVIQ